MTAKRPHYIAFWDRFIKRVRQEHPDWTRATRSQKEFLSMPAPIPGTQIGASFTGDGRLRHNLYINSQEREQNMKSFEMLKDQRGALEQAYGRSLVFEKDLPRSSKGSCSIGEYRAGNVTETESHGELIEWLLDAGVRLRRAIDCVDLLEES